MIKLDNVFYNRPQTNFTNDTLLGKTTTKFDTRHGPYPVSRETYDSVGWRTRIKQGLNATGRLIGNDVVISASPASSLLVNRIDATRTIYQYYDGVPLWLDPYYPGAVGTPIALAADALALEKFVRKIRNAQTKVQSLVALGELGQTLRMLAESGKQLQSGLFSFIWDSYRRIKREPPATRRRRAHTIASDLWLTYVFGVKPLLSDIKGLASAAAQLGATQNPRIFCAGSAEYELPISKAQHTLSLNGLTVLADSLRSVRATVRYYGSVSATKAHTTNQAQSLFGYDWSNIGLSVYELIPYSFIADYFTNLGDVLSAATLDRSTVAWCSKTQRIEGIHRVLGSCDVPMLLQHQHYQRFELDVRTKNVSRQALDTVPTTPLRLKSPNLNQWINMAALGSQHDRARIALH